MTNRMTRLVFFLGKLLIAAVALVAFVAWSARQLVPTVLTSVLLLSVAAAIAGVFAVLILRAICSLQFSQFILRMGGADPQWFCFSGEPQGLAALRRGQVVVKGSGDVS